MKKYILFISFIFTYPLGGTAQNIYSQLGKTVSSFSYYLLYKNGICENTRIATLRDTNAIIEPIEGTNDSMVKTNEFSILYDEMIVISSSECMEKFKTLGWQNRILGMVYTQALEQLDLIEDNQYAKECVNKINYFIFLIFQDKIPINLAEKNISVMINKYKLEEYKVLLEIANEYIK